MTEYVRAEYDKLVFQQRATYSTKHAQEDPQAWQDAMCELIAGDAKRVQAIVETRQESAAARKGFTLIEISILLVIIGLIVGGVLVGQNLIEAAQTRKAISGLEKYQIAITIFRDKYSCLPGDCANAATFFGQNPNCPNGAGSGTQTCNGNGDGLIDYLGDPGIFWSWQQLSAARMIEGQFTGVPGPGGANDAVMGINTPFLGYEQSGCEIVAFASTQWGGPPNYYDHPLQNVIYCGNKVQNDFTYAWAFRGFALSSIDTKIDDGKPGTGRVRATASSGCVTTIDPTTAAYVMTSTVCSQLLLLLGN